MEFRISSALKDLIGRELITDDQTAIFELVKNSFDAQADKVIVKFDNVHDGDAQILIADDGIGMNRDDIENKWLFVGYSEKKENVKNRPKKYGDSKRVFAGAKGIGRFSCDRLGALLTIYSKTEAESHLNELIVFWDRFEEDQEKEFQTIEVDYHALDIEQDRMIPFVKEFFSQNLQGTVLRIEALRSIWDAKKIQNLRTFLQRLINPLQIGESLFRIFIEAPDFYEYDDLVTSQGKTHLLVNGEIENFVLERLKLKTITIQATITDSEITTQLVDKDETIFRLVEQRPQEYSLLKDISVTISYLNAIAKRTFTVTMGIPPVEFGNVFLYKNGFRIHPCGEKDDDWLLISRRKQQGTKRHLGTRDVMGRVEIHGIQSDIREVTSRSGGLVATPTTEQLTDFVYKKALKILERYVVEALDWDRVANLEQKTANTLQLVEKLYGSEIQEDNKDVYVHPQLLAILKKKQIQKIPTIIKDIDDQLPKNATNIMEIRETLATLNRSIELQKREYERYIEYADQEVSLSRALTATDYNQILDYVHNILIQAGLINDNLENLFMLKLEEKERNLLLAIKLENDQVFSISKFLTKPNLLTKQTKEMRDIVAFFTEYVVDYPNLDTARFKLITETNPPKLIFPLKFRPIDATIIIDNVISNSRKFNSSKVIFRFTKISDSHLQISFIDDGEGLESSIYDTEVLFNKGVTTTSGSGVGLFSIKRSAQNICKKSKVAIDKMYDKGFKLDWEVLL